MSKFFKQLIKGFIASIFSFAMVFLLSSFLMHPYNFFEHGFLKGHYELSSNWEQKNSVEVNAISQYCDLPGSSTETKVECVVVHFGRFYNYTNHTKTYPQILKSDTITTEGYICRDIAIFYDAVFTQMGFETDYVMVPNHIYNVIKKENETISCVVNMKRYECW